MRHLSRLISGLLLSLSWWIGAMAAPLPFTDVSPTDSYYQSLQTLYDGGIITDTSDHLFRPSEQMDRDLYVSLVVGVGCKQCLTPSVEDYLRYTTDPFIDLTKTNRYYYCISYAKEREIVQGYQLDASGQMICENTTIWRNPPFCAQNTITRIEAVAVLLRRASLWSDTLNAGSYERKKEISDVSPYWYGYAQKGVEADLITIKNNGTIGADEKISRAEFVTMAAKILRLNQCTTTNPDNKFESEIRVYDSTTNIETSETTPTKPLTLVGYPQSQTGSYSLTLTRVGSDESRSYTGATISNILLSEGSWVTRLTLTDTTTQKSSSSITTIVSRERGNTQSQLGVEIRASPLSVNIGEPIDFSSIISGGSGSISFLWQLGDGGSSSEKHPVHTYQNPGIYTVTLLVRDTSGNISIAQIVVRVGGDRDTDKDRIHDTRDLCPLVIGIAPTGCPDIPANPHRDILIGSWTKGENTGSGNNEGGNKGWGGNEGRSNFESEIGITDSETGRETTETNPSRSINLEGYPLSGSGKNYIYQWNLIKVGTNDTLTHTGSTVTRLPLSEGVWITKLIVTDRTTRETSTATATIVSRNNSGGEDSSGTGNNGNNQNSGSTGKKSLGVIIQANPLTANIGDTIDFLSLISGGSGSISLLWNLGDGGSSSEKNLTHIYQNPGVYTVTLTVRDSGGDTARAQIVIKIGGGGGIRDGGDRKGSAWGDIQKNLCHRDVMKTRGIIIGSPLCLQCPCETQISILDTIRECDILFPTILSPDKQTMYSRGGLYQVR